MSTSAKTLPERASVEFLRTEARDLHRAFQAGVPEAIERISTHLPRAGGLSADELSRFELSRQEAQHALACSYGLRKWEELIAVAEAPDLEGLAHLTDRGLQIFLREVGQLDLVRVMSTLSQPVCERIFGNMSQRVQQFLRTEIGLLGEVGEVGEQDLATSRDRMVQSLLDLAHQGWLQWPPGAQSAAPPRTAPDFPDLSAEPRFAHMQRPLLDISEADLAETLLSIAEQARRKGILSLETLPSTAPTLLTEAVQYVVDGTEPDLVQDLIETRGATILRHRTVRGHMAIDGWMSIQSGDTPIIVRIKVETYFRDAAVAPADELHQMDERQQVTVDELVQRLGETPLMQMSDEQWAMLYMDMACIARGDGIHTLEPLLEVIDDGVLRVGMRASLVDQSPPHEVQRDMESHLQLLRLSLKRLEAMVLTGIADIQAGRKPREIVESARAAAEEQGAQLLAAGYPARGDG